MDNNKRVLEALKMQPLSEEEKTSRHILGRLYGPIATTTESTRNGRLYNRTLWENALSDEVFQEKVARKSLFLELGHPADREETDMTKICACIPEIPKIVDNDLYAYVDILDTPNGKLLKTLCDYGFVPGISSRGSGDVLENNEVDPETFYLETWDIVQLPAVKKARLTVCEGLDTKNIKLKKALTESLNKASEEDKEVMKKTLENLNIDLEDETTEITEAKGEKTVSCFPGGTPKDDNLIPILEEEVETETITEAADDDVAEEEATEESAENETEESTEEEEVEFTAGDLAKDFGKLDKKTPVEIELNKTTDGYEVSISATDTENPDNVVKYGTTFAIEEIDGEVDNIEETSEEAEEDVDVTETEEAVDDGADEEVIESLKSAIRENTELKKRIKTLEGKNAGGDSTVKELQEEVQKYKNAFERTSVVAAKAKKLETEVNKLKESLKAQAEQVKQLQEALAKSTKLVEGVDASNVKINKLNESLNAAKTAAEEAEKKLQEQAELNRKTVAIAKKYKEKYVESVNKYIASKANMLGVTASDIKRRLSEGFTIEDIDKVCDKMLTESVGMNRLPFGNSRGKMTIRETGAPKQQPARFAGGYEIDDDLLVLAGLKD